MKVICTECRKKYDYDDHMGICPQCGRYMKSQLGEHHNVEEKKNLERQEEEAPSFRKDKKRFKFCDIISILVVIMMIVSFLVVKFIMIPGEIKEIYQVQKEVEPERIIAGFNQTINIEGIDIHIKEIQPFVVDKIEAPKGWKYVQLPYSIYSDDFSYAMGDTLAIYLNIDNFYVEPLSKYDFPEYGAEDAQGRWNLEAEEFRSFFTQTVKGRFVFLVPEDLKEYHIIIHQKEMDKEDKKVVTGLKRIYYLDSGEEN